MVGYVMSAKHRRRTLEAVRAGEHPVTAVRENLSPNERVAMAITNRVGTMWCAYAFMGLALVALPSAIQHGSLSIVQWISQTFLQLVLLSIIMVGQNLMGRHAEARAEADHVAVQQSFQDAEATMKHLDEQDEAMKRLELQTQRLVRQLCQTDKA